MKKLRKLILKRRNLFIILPVFAVITSFGLTYVLIVAGKNTKAVASCHDTCVALKGDKADPETITVAKGTYVQFNSADGKTHDLSHGKGGEQHEHTGKFHSGEIKADEGWRVQFNEEGSFYFHDHLNPKISILVIVYTPGKDYRIH